MSLYKYVSYENLLNILDGTIRFTQPGAFNDPFEMLPEFYVPEELDTKPLSLEFSVTAPRSHPIIGELPDDFEPDSRSDLTARNIREELDKAIGVLCLTRNDASLTMWAHYAEGYSGALIEFDETNEFFKGQIDVAYSEKRSVRDVRQYIAHQDQGRIPIADLAVKSTLWEHEEEVRVVRSLADCIDTGTRKGNYSVYVMNLPVACIKSITMGERMNILHQRKVWQKVKGIDTLSLHLGAIPNWGYGFRKEPIKYIGSSNPVMSPRTAHIFSEENGTHGQIARWSIDKHPLSEMVNKTV